MDTLREDGSIQERGSNQFELEHLMWEIFGDPDKLLNKRH